MRGEHVIDGTAGRLFHVHAVQVSKVVHFLLRRPAMGRLSLETRSEVIIMKKNGYAVSEIQNRLSEEGVYNSLDGVVVCARKKVRDEQYS